MSIVEAKDALRSRMRTLRAGIARADRSAWSVAITERVLASVVWREAGAVALFRSLPQEVSTTALLDAARAAGKVVALPAVIGPGRPLAFRRVDPDGPALVKGVFGILEPPLDAPEVDLAGFDLVLVPALAVDLGGGRLGYGKGYYDRTLAGAPAAFRLAVAFDGQVVDRVPVDATDERMHALVTPTRWVDCSG